MANAADQEWQKVEKAACIIVAETKDEGGNPVRYKGTGFHYGGGWIMTVAHNFQDDKEPNKTFHNIFSDAQFEVKFDIGGQEYVFEKQKRVAFIHHLEPGDHTDFKNKDIAMVKLGHQWEYGGRNFTGTGEEEERQRLDAMSAHGFSALCEMDPPSPEINETVYAVHYGGASDNKKYDESKILRITSAPNQVPMLHLKKKAGVLPAGSSGCPIMVKKEGKYHLAGLHFSGGDDDKDGKAQALQWSRGIHGYINTGVLIIADIGSYMAYSKLPGLQLQAQKSRQCLELEAKAANLTIYLCNGEVINQQ